MSIQSEPLNAESLFSPLIEHAAELAAQWHDATYRKGRWRDPFFDAPEGERLRVPVMAHLTAVALTVQRAGWDDTTVAAALLHDALEDANRYDQRLRRAQLHEMVGDEVVSLVADVTEVKRDDSGQRRGWHARKQEYVAQLREGPVRAVAISLADKLHNLWTMNESLARGIDVFESTARRVGLSAGPEAQQRFYRAVLETSRAHDDPRLAPMRARLDEEIVRFETLCELIDD